MPNKHVTSEQALLLENQLCFALHAASMAMTKVYHLHLKKLGVTYPQYLVMLVLWERDGLAVSDIGKRLSLDSGTLTPLLKRLEAAGLVSRLRDVEDERRVIVQLTAAGRKLKTQAKGIPGALLQATGCTQGELADLKDRVLALRRQLVNVQ